jgi:DNA repair protein RadC
MLPICSAHSDKECVYCIFLDSKNKILAIEKISNGTINSSYIYTRELIKEVLLKKAKSIILAHNHPSGDTAPSNDDLYITKQVFVACKSIDVSLHDHIIVGDNYHSMNENGIITRFNREYVRFIKNAA